MAINENMSNSVELLGHYGSDTVHAQSAWTSTSRDLTEDKLARVDKLLKMLASEGHHTPFEKSGLHFLVNVDQATHIHLLKHRVGVSINGESARYKELKEDKMMWPADWSGVWKDKLRMYTEEGNKLYHEALEYFSPILGRKRAKESARFFKTFNSQISMDIMFNWRSFYHFQKLRNSPDAQKEVRELAEEMLNQVKNIEGNPFEKTIKAFGL
ncbi:MAG: FAD-dependent thymidylate synthase [Winogradskyella sp.]|uniref:FAD-dependent thymidylate synthase n=1 Tax=Winogradskyella sp. TaxID=1883156 RepID=UPI0017C67377|nr:FAD-dependent thymidylate synthase [Winogradskyella sp.]